MNIRAKIVQIAFDPNGVLFVLASDGKVWKGHRGNEEWTELWRSSETLPLPKEPLPSYYRKPLSECEKLSTRAIIACDRENVLTLGQLSELSELRVHKWKNVGRKTVRELRDLLADHDMHFGSKDEP